MSTEQLDIDILLYVALAEEFNTLFDILTEYHPTVPREIKLTDLPLTMFSVSVQSSSLKKSFNLGIVPAGKMGNTHAASVVSAVLDQSNCNDVVVLGIAGSLSDDLQPGDVFIPDSITEYLANSAAINDSENGQWKFETSGNSHITTPRLLNNFQLFKSKSKGLYEQWVADCASRCDPLATEDVKAKMAQASYTMRSEIKLFAGDDKKLASGPAVGKGAAFVDWLKSKDRKFVAIEMESAGVYDAATTRSNPPRVLAIRGISDFADERKTLIEDATKGQFRVIAIKNSFSLLYRGIEAGFFEPEEASSKGAITEPEADKWTRIRRLSKEWIDQVHTTLPNGLELPRADETAALQKAYSECAGAHVLGESGLGKSALLKQLAIKAVEDGSEVVWIKAERFGNLHTEIPELAEVLLKTKCASGLLVIDSLENCYAPDQLDLIGRFVATIVEAEGSIWKVFLACQTPSWSRVSSYLLQSLDGHHVFTKRIECKRLSDSDFDLVRESFPAIKKLSQQPRLNQFLRSPKMLDMLLRNEPDLTRLSIGEADVVDWWWEEQVKCGKGFSGEEGIARALAIHLADSLTSEAEPDVVAHDHEATNSLIGRQILSRTDEGRIRFDHDLLADWARVIHLRSLGSNVFTFIRQHSENPPWLRAIRIFSQHLLDRASDYERWQSIVDACRVVPPAQEEPDSRNLQILDTWLEGIVYCSDPTTLLKKNREQLFADKAWLLKRLLRRMLHNATFPDPFVQRQFQKINPDIVDYAALRHRLPIMSLWSPFISFLIENQNETTDFLPVILAEIGLMWGKAEEYTGINWEPLAELILLNAEKELRREVAGVYGDARGIKSLDGETNARVTIYSAALRTASQNPDRALILALKAAGRKDWDQGDLTYEAGEGWRGEWRDRSFAGGHSSHVIYPIEAWADGPCRLISHDFYRAWFKVNTSLPCFEKRPVDACEVTLALLIDWPKTEVNKGSHHVGIDRHGFRFDADYQKIVFWFTGPFIGYLRSNWRPAVELVIRLINFATDRYEDWCPNSLADKQVTIKTPDGDSEWKGNHQIFSWNRYHMHTPQVVTCALMALEKWFYERIDAGESVSDAINLIFREGQSLALIGVLINVGKRHESLFVTDLKPLLFARALYNLDLQSTIQNVGVGWMPFEDAFISNAKREWDDLPGRKTWLKDACLEWMLTKSEFKTVFAEVSSSFNQDAKALPEGSTERETLIRWAVEFNPELWAKRQLENGQVEFYNERLDELRDVEGEKDNSIRQKLLLTPRQCAELLKERLEFEDSEFSTLWDLLQNHEFWDRAEELASQEPSADELLDPRHARSGMIAVLVCLGEEWLNQDPGRFDYLDGETRRILDNRPEIKAFKAEDTRDDFEGFLARIAVRRWAANPDDEEWRDVVGRFVVSYRYHTVHQLFDEAFKCRERLGVAYGELEALALVFSAVRQETTNIKSFEMEEAKNDLITWMQEWLSKFARGEGPKWTDDWASIEFYKVPQPLEQDDGLAKRPLTLWYNLHTWIKSALLRVGIGEPINIESYSEHDANEIMTADWMQRELRRIGYDLDMGIILATFGHLPKLSDATNSSEREHWITICKEILATFHRTLPLADTSDGVRWRRDAWSDDQKVFKIAAAKLFECSLDEERGFWECILNLPPAAHHHVERFLYTVLFEAKKIDPPNIAQLTKFWILFADHLSAQDNWVNGKNKDAEEVWKVLLLEIHLVSTEEAISAPLVRQLVRHYPTYITRIKHDMYKQRELVAFLTTEAANPIFIDALVWLHDGWKEPSRYLWGNGIEYEVFENLLEFGWKKRFEAIRQNPKALSAFKTLTLNLAAHNNAVAIDIQNRIGGSDTR